MAEHALDTVSSEAPVTASTGGMSIDALLGTDKGLADDLIGVQRQKVSDEKAVLGQTVSRMEEDRAVMRRAFAREGAAIDDIKPWNAQAEKQKYATDPIQEFGSFASVFAIAASAFTKNPMINAMNASAAAIGAARERNDKDYDRAYEAFKTNTELAIKRGNMMHQQYSDALQLLNTDMTLGETKLKALAAQYGDQQTLTMMEHGMLPQVFEMMTSRAKATEGLVTSLEKFNDFTFKAKALENDPEFKSGDPIRMYGARQRYFGEKTIDQTFVDQWWANEARPEELKKHPDETPQEKLQRFTKAAADFKRAQSPYSTRMATDERSIEMLADEMIQKDPSMSLAQARLQAQRQLSQAKSPGSADERTIDARARELMQADDNLSLAQARLKATQELTGAKSKKTMSSEDLRMIEQKASELRRDDPSLPETEAYRQARLSIRGGKLLDDASARRMAELWIRGDHTVFQNLGRGLQGSENVGKVWEEINKLATERGLKPEMLIKNAAEVKGLAAGEQTLYRRQANVIAAAEGFIQVAPTVINISDQISRTRYPTVNSILLAAERGTGDEKVVRLAAAINGAINTYSRAINGGTGQGYVNDKEHARQILDIAYSKGQMRAAVDQLTIEVNAELLAPGQSKEVMYDMFTGAAPLQLKTQKTGGASGLSDDEIRKKLGIK